MYNEHDNGGGSGPEHMKIRLSVLAIPMLSLSGGCDVCNANAKRVIKHVLTLALRESSKAFIEFMKIRGNCEVELMDEDEANAILIGQLGIDKQKLDTLIQGINIDG